MIAPPLIGAGGAGDRMDNTRYVHFNAVENGGLYLYGDTVDNVSADAIRWEDFQTALVRFGIPSLRTIPTPEPIYTAPTPAPEPPRATRATLERDVGMTVDYALSNLYGRRLSQPMQSGIVGRVISFKHKRGHGSIVVMGMITAAFRKAHRAYTSHVSYADGGNAAYFNTGQSLLNRVNSAVYGLSLNSDEQWFLLSFYQNLLANY